MTTQITGEVIPSDKPGTLAMALREPVGVLVGMAPWNAPVILGVRAVAMPLACGNTVVLKASEICPAHAPDDRRDAERAPACPRACSTSSPTRAEDAPEVVVGADRPSQGHAHQLHRLDAGRADRRRAGGAAPEAGAARARRQGAAGGARRCRPRRRGQRRGLRRLHEPGPDLHVDREDRRRRQASPTTSSSASPRRRRRCRTAIRRGHVVLGSVVDRAAVERMAALIDDAVAKGAELVTGGATDTHDHAGDRGRPGDAGDADLLRGVLRPGRRGGARRRRRAGGAPWPTTATTASPPPSSAATSPGRSRWRGGSSRASCHVNGPTVHDEAQMPFGGVKASGYGRFGGKAAIDAFTELRWVTIEDAGQPYPF